MEQMLNKDRVYLQPGQNPPKGASVQTGPKGGHFYNEGSKTPAPQKPEEDDTSNESGNDASSPSKLTNLINRVFQANYQHTINLKINGEHYNTGKMKPVDIIALIGRANQSGYGRTIELEINGERYDVHDKSSNKSLDPEPFSKAFAFDGINDDEMRKFSCWGSVEVVDRQREIIPIDEVYKIMDIWMDRGAPIMFRHSNRQVGKGVNWRPAEKDGNKGVLITGVIFKHYKEDDEVWDGIKKGEFEGLSIGGKSYLKEKDENGNTFLRNLIGYEFSVVERTGNQEATFTEVNAMAKSDNTMKADEPVMDKTPEAPPAEAPAPEQPPAPESSDEISQLKSVIASLIEKIAMIEQKISGAPEPETPIEESAAKEEPEAEAEKEPVAESEVESLKKELNDLKKSIVVKTIETPRPAEVQKKDRHTEARETLKEMSKNGNIDFSQLGKKLRQ